MDLVHGERRARARVRLAARPATPMELLANTAVDRNALTSIERVGARRIERRVWMGFALLGTLMLAYLISLILRGPAQQWAWLDGWSVCAVEGAAAILCIVRGTQRGSRQTAPLLLGFGLLGWVLGDVFLTFEALGGVTPPVPSVADIFYILYYPLAYVAIVMLLRNAMGRLSKPNWLDGIVAGLGAATLCSAFAFHDLLHITGGTGLATAVNLTYPIGDLLLLSLVIGGTVLLSGRGHLPWFLLVGGVAINVGGDTFNFFQGAHLTSTFGNDFNSIAWPASILLMSMSVWLHPRSPDPLRVPRVAGFILPSLAATGGLFILVFATVHPMTEIAVGLATATLAIAGLRLTLSARALRVLTEQHHRQALTDELTELGNRRHLFQVLDSFFSDGANPWTANRKMAFLFIDLNHFKEINDSFGHPAGDEILRQLRPRLTNALPPAGLVFRLGGDELAAVLVDEDAAGAAATAERMLAELAKPFTLQKMNASVGASIGIALAPEDATDSTGLLWCADVAMYRAKLGDTPYAFYDPMVDGAEHQLNYVDDLRDAVENGGFILHYQPQLDLRTGDIMAVEALIRWLHPRLGVVPPLKFIPLAEDAGLMRDLTNWVLGEALTQCARWREHGITLSVSVNVTTTNLLQSDFVEEIAAMLDARNLSGSALVIEITETSMITDFAGSKAVIKQLRELGVIVSIDDFGAGFTSLAYLSDLPVGELKLDRAFICALSGEGKERDLELVRATIKLGHDMGLRVVAEGIEDVETLDLLSELGCDLAQGYFISRPMPADKLSFRTENSPTPVG